MAAESILLVDDQPLVLSAIAHYLTQHGYSIHTAVNGKEALDLMGEFQPDLVITDVVMPVMDGWQLIRSLRASPQYTLMPVIVLTDQDSTESRIQGFTLGADDFVSKTTLVQELEVRIGRALARGAAIAEAISKALGGAPSPSSTTPAPPTPSPPTPAPGPPPRAPVPESPPSSAGPAGGFDLPPLAEAMGQPAAETPKPAAPPVAESASPRTEPPAEPSGTQGLQGALKDIGLASVLTLLESGEHTGVLTLTQKSSRRKARMLVRAGQILKISVDESGDDLTPVLALSELLRWTDATFSFSHQDVTARDEVQASTEHLLMEASQHLDEEPHL